ncbi:helix-turn-helix domain-containing protein [Cohnella fermenti]|uniref:Helix-turn-helix domain-containing protein n=1 Tax=Cohnella fermenti TaxID=2565925 RepID=A0A4S4BLA5_9BACL|nr:AraC family transcriptional regulator [Cohnella fermenti]THF74586.1 helix-turn-helix domain-containing protein [Cohnella fermenti]
MRDNGSIRFLMGEIHYRSTGDWTTLGGLATGHSLVWIVEGKGWIEVDGSALYAVPGSCLVFVPGMVSDWRNSEAGGLKGYELRFDTLKLSEGELPPDSGTGVVAQRAECPFRGEIAFRDTEEAERLIRQLYRRRLKTGALARLETELAFMSLICLVWKEAELPREDGTSRAGGIERTIAYMNHRYREPMTREKLAAIAGMSLWSYATAFKKSCGVGPMEYLTAIRMARAKERLLLGRGKLREIARDVGFNSEFYFSSKFKQHVGMPPIDYANRHRGRYIRSGELGRPLAAAAVERPAGAAARIIGLYLEDHLCCLGIRPVLQFAMDDYTQRYLQPYMEAVPELDVKRFDCEAIRASEPDLILLGISDFAVQGRYDECSGIAPTYVMEAGQDGWRSTLRAIAGLLDKTEPAERAIRRCEEQAGEVRRHLQRTVGTQSVALVRVCMHKHLWLYGNGSDNGSLLYEELGLRMPTFVQQRVRGDTAECVDLREFETLDADIVLLIVDPLGEGRQRADRLMSDPLWPSVSTGRTVRLHELTFDCWTSSGAIAQTAKLEELSRLLS